MAKTIKFSLIMNNVAVRDIEGLQENFYIDDLLQVYRNGLLLKWLEVRGYEELAKQVREIIDSDDLTIAQQLVSILGMEQDEAKIKQTVTNIRFRQEWLVQLDKYKKAEYQTELIITDYHMGYDNLKSAIHAKKEDMAFLKSAINEVYTRYLGLFRLNPRDFYFEFKDEVPRVILAVVIHKQLRQFFLEHETINENLMLSKNFNGDAIKKLIESGEVKTFSGETQDYWKDIESKGKEYLVLSMIDGNYVRPQGVKDIEYAAKDINGKYLILDVIDYKSKNPKHTLVYMEV